MEQEQRTLWLDVLGKLHTRLRKLALAGLVLLVAVAGDWLFRHRQLAEEQLRSTPKLEELVLQSLTGEEQSKLGKEIHQALSAAGCQLAAPAPAKRIRIACIPSLSQEVRSAGTSRSSWKIFGQELPEVIYRSVILFAPMVLLLGTIVTGSQLRRLHFLLTSEVSTVAVQQKLNSPYFTRVTTTYGEGRIVQIVIVAAINLVHVLVAFMYVPAVLVLSNVVEVAVMDGRIVDAHIGVTGEGAPNALISSWIAVLLCALALWVVVVIIFARLVGTPGTGSEETKEGA